MYRKGKRQKDLAYSSLLSLSGLSPFLGDDDNETLNNILACSWDFEDEEFQDVSEQAKDFISKLLIKEKWYVIPGSLKHVLTTIVSYLYHLYCSTAELSLQIKVFNVHVKYFYMPFYWCSLSP